MLSEQPTPTSAAELALENEELREQLREAHELITAVRSGAVDALAIQGSDGPRIFTLEGADQGYRELIEQLNEGALLLDRSGSILYANAALATNLGCPLSEILSSNWVSFVAPSYENYWQQLLAQGWAGRARGEMPLRACDGRLRPSAVSISVLTFQGAQVAAVLVADLSDRHEVVAIRALVREQNTRISTQREEIARQESARERVEQAAAEARRLLEGIPHIAWTANPAGRITYLNQRWFDYSGAPPGEERPIMQRMHPDDLPNVLERWTNCLADGHPYEVECRIASAEGRYRWMLGRGNPSHDAQGQVMEWIGTYTDINEHRSALEHIAHTQKLLRANNAQLTRVNADLDNFVYAASHDLKQPVNNIEGLLQALLEELPTERSRPMLDISGMMVNSVERLRRTVEQLTDVSQLQREVETPSRVSLSDVVHDVRLDLLPLITAANAVLVLEVADCPPLSFQEKNLRSLVYNLLSNAIKYRDPARRLHVLIHANPTTDGQVRLLVQDNGLGLSLASQRKLFGMFQRMHSHVEGSGIGLYMVKRMVENVGGHVEVASEEGVGSTFTVWLPQYR